MFIIINASIILLDSSEGVTLFTALSVIVDLINELFSFCVTGDFIIL